MHGKPPVELWVRETHSSNNKDYSHNPWLPGPQNFEVRFYYREHHTFWTLLTEKEMDLTWKCLETSSHSIKGAMPAAKEEKQLLSY